MTKVNVSFSAQTTGFYQMWLRTLYAPVSTGNLSFVLDGEKLIAYQFSLIAKHLKGSNGYSLVLLNLTSGTHTFEIVNTQGYSALSDIGVVPQIAFQQALQNISRH